MVSGASCSTANVAAMWQQCAAALTSDMGSKYSLGGMLNFEPLISL